MNTKEAIITKLTKEADEKKTELDGAFKHQQETDKSSNQLKEELRKLKAENEQNILKVIKIFVYSYEINQKYL